MSQNRKNAFTLVEMIVVMALLSTVLGISIGLLFQVFEFHDRQEERAVQDLRIERLVRQFRNDVHQWGCPTISPSPDDLPHKRKFTGWNDSILIGWTNDEKTVTYMETDGPFPEKRLVIRTETNKNGQNREERYDLPDHATVWFVNGEGTYEGLTAMSIWTPIPGITWDDLMKFDPFTRTLSEKHADRVPSEYAENWRTIIAHEME